MTTKNSFDTELDPLFLELGKALFICQSLEESLCLLHAQMSHDKAAGEDGAFKASWDFHSTKTLGQLINALRKRIDVPDDLSTFLEYGLNIRNKIVHGFITKNAQRMFNPLGRVELENELAAMKIEVKMRDVLVNKLIDAILSKYGISNADLKRHADQQWEHVNKSASG